MKDSTSENSSAKRRKALPIIIAIAAAVVTLICFILMQLNYPGMNIAFCIAAMISAVIYAYMFLRTLRANDKYSKLAKILQRCISICLLICSVGFIILETLIISASHTDTEEAETRCMVILGAGLYGEYPSRILVSRLDAALEYLDNRDDMPIVVSGGQGPGETITEAEAMSRYLERRGIDKNRIYKEENSTSTFENLVFSLALMEEYGLYSEDVAVAIVTSEFHLYRAKSLAKQLGLYAIGVAAETPYPSLRILYYFREAVALLNSLLFS